MKVGSPIPPIAQKAMIAGVILAVVLGLIAIAMIWVRIPNKDVDVISRHDAYMMAFNDSGAAKKEVTFEVMTMKDDERPLTYLVYFYDNDYYYKYVINAEEGSIMDKKVLEGGGPRYSDQEGTVEDIDLE